MTAPSFVPRYEGQFPSLGEQVGMHIEKHLGITLMREQRIRLVHLYRLDHQGRRVIRRAGLRRPKGAGKSPEGAYIGFGELTGPVVFAGWDDNGQPVGRRHPNPWVQFAAVSEDQTDNVLVWLFDTLSDRPETLTDLRIDLGRTRIYLKGEPGRIEPVTAAAGSREGQPVSFAVLDQTEAWKKENGGVRLAAVLRRNAAKTGGWTYELQNAPEPGDGSVADQTARAYDRGQVGVFFDTREPTKLPELADRPALVESLKEVYGESADRGYVNPERLADECVDPDTEPSDAFRFYLNVGVPSQERAFDVELWGQLAHPEIVVPDGSLITLGFDGARYQDATALIATTVAEGHQFPLGIWEKPELSGEEWEVEETAVAATLEGAMDTFDVWRMYGDPPFWERSLGEWAGRWEQVAMWDTRRTKEMAYALRAYRNAMRAKELSHDGDSTFARHVANARRRPQPQLRDEDQRPMWTIRKDHAASPLKIDAAMAGCLSWKARLDALAAGAQQAHEPFAFFG